MTAAAVGLLLAAGAGRRMGRPKALLTDRSGRSHTDLAVDRLLGAGCAEVTVVLGAGAEEARALLRDRPDARRRVVEAPGWAEGIGGSLRHGLDALATAPPEVRAVVVTLVDLPDVDEAVIGRVLDRWRAAGAASDALVRATYAGEPGHPVLIGRDHWAPLRDDVEGDSGARGYLGRRKVLEVSCEDLATGRDVDRPEEL